MKPVATFFKWGFFLLVALNITLIFLVLFPRRDDHHPGPPRFDRIIAHLDSELKLSKTQHQQLVQLFALHKREMDSMHRQRDSKHGDMIDCLKSGDQDCGALQKTETNFDQILFRHHQRILKILSATQQQRYLKDLDEHRPPGPPPF